MSLEIINDTFDNVQPKEISRIPGNLKARGEILIAAHINMDDIANKKSDSATSSDNVLNFIKNGTLQLK